MGAELHIVRLPESQENKITAEEWLSCIESDSELQRQEAPDHPKDWITATVTGAEEWETLVWSGGSISARAPQSKMTSKMLDLAERLGAVTMTDDGIILKRGEDGRIQVEEP